MNDDANKASTAAADTAADTGAIANNGPAPRVTFYRRPLPDSCVAFSSAKGKAYFASAMKNRGLKSFFALMEQHTTQSEPAYCGISTLVIVLNALSVDPRRTWKGPWRWYEERMINCCLDMEEVKKTGITLNEFGCLAVAQGLSAETHFADSNNNNQNNNGDGDSTVDDFRRAVERSCVEETADSGDNDKERGRRDDDAEQPILVVSYSRKIVGQTGSGHFSPIAAYDKESDSVLILDTARFKYGAHWIKLPLLYEAMKPIDPDTGRSRGYVLLTVEDDDDGDDHLKNHPHSTTLPRSLLLRSRMKQTHVRREFKEYLTSLPARYEIRWNDVLRYWTKDGTDPNYIFQMVEPQLKPSDDEDELKGKIRQVRALLADLISSTTTNDLERDATTTTNTTPPPPPSCSVSSACSTSCVSNNDYTRTLHLKPVEPIFIVYLACMEKSRRRDMIFDERRRSSAAAASEFACQQLLSEAELVQWAIDISDQTDAARF